MRSASAVMLCLLPSLPSVQAIQTGNAEYLLGVKLSEQQHYREAIKHFNKAIETDPKCASCFYQRGLAYLKLKAWDEADYDIHQCQKLDPTFKVGADVLAEANKGANKFQDAVTGFDTAIVKEPKNVQLFFERGQTYHQEGNLPKAIADFTTVVTLDPTNHKAFTERAQCYRQLKQWDKAIADYTSTLKLRPTSCASFLHRGDCYLELHKDTDALADYAVAIKLKPREARPYSFRARAYERMGRKDLAEQDKIKARQFGEDFKI